jgi:hypothetical protein
MLKMIRENLCNRDILLGRPNLTLKNIQCGNITCNKRDKFKKYKDNMYLCECGYILQGEFEIEETHKVKFGCSKKDCPEGKSKMTADCLKCNYIKER